MDWSLLIFAIVVVIFGYRGYRNGLLKTFSRVASLVAGYLVAIFYFKPVAAILTEWLGLQGIVSHISASLILFLAASMLVSILFWAVAKLLPARENKSRASAIAGAAMGIVVGVVVAIAIVWTYAFVRDMRPGAELASQPDTRNSGVENLANRVAGKAVTGAMSLGSVKPEVRQLSAALVESPAEISQRVQRLAGSSEVRELLQDPRNQVALNSGDAEAVRALPAFQQLAHNPDVQALARASGMMDEHGENPEAVEAELASRVTDIWGRVQRAKNDARVQEILSDPEFQLKIQSQNPLDLLTNAQLLELADIIFSDDAKASDAENPGPAKEDAQETKIYSWTDKDGRLHYSDVEPRP